MLFVCFFYQQPHGSAIVNAQTIQRIKVRKISMSSICLCIQYIYIVFSVESCIYVKKKKKGNRIVKTGDSTLEKSLKHGVRIPFSSLEITGVSSRLGCLVLFFHLTQTRCTLILENTCLALVRPVGSECGKTFTHF